jgi:hypothetical protein
VNHCRVEKNLDDVETTVVRRSWDEAPAGPAYGRSGIRHTGGLNLEEAVVWNMRNLGVDANGEATSGVNHEGESTNAALRGGLPGSSEQAE